MLVVHATVPIVEDRREDAIDLFTEVAEASREEEGVIDYRVTSDLEEPTVFRVIEQYEDEAAFGAHAASDHFQEFAAALPEMLAGEPEIMQYNVESSEEVEL